MFGLSGNSHHESGTVMQLSATKEYESKELGFTNSKEILSCVNNTNFKTSKLMMFVQKYIQESLTKIYNELVLDENGDVSQYYADNKDFLSDEFNINNLEELQNFKKSLQNLKIDFNTYSKVDFIEDSGQSDKRNFSIKMQVFYENGSSIKLHMQSDINYNVKFKILEEE